MSRMKTKGLLGYSIDDTIDMVLRVGASCYEVPEEIKEFEIKYKIQEQANQEMIKSLEY